MIQCKSLPAILAAISLAAPAAAQTAVTKGVVFQDVTIVKTSDGTLTPHRQVILEDGRIKTITASKVRTSGEAQSINAAGKFLVPGFVDVHAHVVDTAKLTPSYFPLLIANGVTAVREESAVPPLMALAKQVNEDAAAGRLLAPEIIFQGGEEHLLPTMSALDASNAGKPSMDHLGAGWGLILDCSTDADAIRKDGLANGYHLSMPPPADFVLNPRAFDGAANAAFYQRIIDTYSDARCTTLSQAFVKNHTWQTLTLIRLRTQDWGNDPVYRDDPNLKYVSKERRAQWDSLGDRFATLPASAVATLQSYYKLQQHVSKLMSQNGVRILAGSDTGGVWVIPGFSMHQEFHELAASGLSPLEVLQAATSSAAEFLHREASMGSVDEGKNADLVLLNANPIQNAANLDGIYGVVLRGKYLSAAELAKMKSDVAQAYR